MQGVCLCVFALGSLFIRLYYKLVMTVLFVVMGISGEKVKVWFAYK